MKQGRICIYWEIKPDHIVAAVEMDEDTKRLPLVMRRHIVTRLREVLIPAKHDRRAAEGVGPYGRSAGGAYLQGTQSPSPTDPIIPGREG